MMACILSILYETTTKANRRTAEYSAAGGSNFEGWFRFRLRLRLRPDKPLNLLLKIDRIHSFDPPPAEHSLFDIRFFNVSSLDQTGCPLASGPGSWKTSLNISQSPLSAERFFLFFSENSAGSVRDKLTCVFFPIRPADLLPEAALTGK